ncbi:glycosyltransferase [Serratia ureilytica]
MSIVLPVYNESDRIEAVLLSLFNQNTKDELITHDTYELIIVDNNSTDDSVAKINAFSESHPVMDILVIDEKVQGSLRPENAVWIMRRCDLKPAIAGWERNASTISCLPMPIAPWMHFGFTSW